MKKVLAVLALILFTVLPLSAQKVGADSATAVQLAQIWLDKVNGPSKDFVACASSHYEGEDLNIDSIVKLVPVAPDSIVCKGVGNTILVFITETSPGAQNEVLIAYLKAIHDRADIRALGAIHGVVPEVMPNGHRVFIPLVWAVWRDAPQNTDTLKHT